MRVCFVSRGGIAEFMKSGYQIDADMIVCGFRFLNEVNYEKELKGESNYFEGIAHISRKYQTLVISGCVTDTKGHKRKSAVVAENGRILGVSDMMNAVDGEVGSGAALRVYDTKTGRVGVMVAEDLYFPEVVKALALCGSDFIVCPYGVVENSVESVLLRADAFCYGVPIFFCGVGYAAIAEVDGDLAFATPLSPVETEHTAVKEYHLVETRRRGFYKAPKKEF